VRGDQPPDALPRKLNPVFQSPPAAQEMWEVTRLRTLRELGGT
jgi:hypothetical protein